MSLKLSDKQRKFLSAAAEREDSLLAISPQLKGATAQKVGAKLVAAGLAKEVKAKSGGPVYRVTTPAAGARGDDRRGQDSSGGEKAAERKFGRLRSRPDTNAAPSLLMPRRSRMDERGEGAACHLHPRHAFDDSTPGPPQNGCSGASGK